VAGTTEPITDPSALPRAIADSYLSWVPIVERLEGAQLERGDGFLRWTSDIALPVFNGVITDLERPVTDDWVDEMLATFDQPRIPLLWADVRDLSGLGSALRARGFEVTRPAAMAIELEALPAPELSDGVSIREVDADLQTLYTATTISMVSNGFPEYAAAPMLRAVARVPDRAAIRNFLLEVDGEPAAASTLMLAAGVAGLYNVGTLERFRRRGFGRAISIAAMAAGREANMRFGVLQASEMGEPVYRSIGFQVHGRQMWASR
jgi:GNAT superfamily N-acetyltransferase